MARKHQSFLRLVLLSCALGAAAHCEQEQLMRRQISSNQLRQSYDYIVAGGGQAGIVVAARLSEDPSKTVLVVEYGTFENDPAQLEPTSAFGAPLRDRFNLTALPNPALNNRTGIVLAASVIGGGSAINSMFFNRGSAEDYNNWEKLGNPGWGWNSLFPYFKKSTTFNTPIDPAIVSEYNITWDQSAYGNGPIEVTYPPWQWPATKNQFTAFNEIGVPTQREHANGRAYNAFWVPSCVDPNSRRSYARNRYYDPNQSRQNLHVLVHHRVNEVVFSRTKRAEAVKIQARGTPDGSNVITIRAKKEVVLAAGWLHTPHILQRSGVGPKALLQQANIPVVADLPGVGSNFQDHPQAFATFNYTRDLVPNRSFLTNNASFIAFADQQWLQRKGPRSPASGNAAVLAPLTAMDPQGFRSIAGKIITQSAASFLPKSYTLTQVAGFIAQRTILAASYLSPTNGLLEILISGSPSPGLILMKPLSRGTVLLNTTNPYAEPILNYNTNSNPVDVSVAIAGIKFVRRWQSAPALQPLGPVELTPGANVTSDADLSTYLANIMGPTSAHGCCTASMMPRVLGGVVSPQLLVYGVTGLSIADVSVMPLIPATHTCATVYAIAEKAADLIKARNA